MTIYDIAEKAGVSVATVSRVLNNSDKVRPKTRQKILDIMEQEGYTPNIFARGLGLNSIKMIGIMCTDVSDLYYATAVSFLERELRHQGFNSILSCTGSRLEDKKQSMAILLEKHVDAVILVGSAFKESTDNSHIRAAAASAPVIAINSHIELPGVYCYLCAEDEITAQATRSLFEAGCNQPVFAYDGNSYSTALKKEGFLRAHTQSCRPLHPQQLLRTTRDFACIEQDFTALAAAGFMPDAVIASTDLLAIGLQKALAKAGRTLPIIGFDNSILASCATPSLSSIDNRLENICLSAVAGLVSLFEGTAPPPQTYFQGQLVVRESFIPKG